MSKKAEPKHTLPEIASSDKKLVNAAKEAIAHRTKAATETKLEKEARKDMEEHGHGIYFEEFDKDNIIGLIRVIDEDIPPTRIEMRINNGALDVSEEDILKKHLNGRHIELFERTRVITEIHDPAELIKVLENKGLNPWDYFDLKVKDNMDSAVYNAVNGEFCESAEAFLPKQGFLSRLRDMFNFLDKNARKYIREYLSQAVKPIVVLGTTKSK